MKKLFAFLFALAVVGFGLAFESVEAAVSLAFVPGVMSTDYMRYVWEKLRAEGGADVAQAFADWRVQPAVIRLEKDLTANATSYKFPLLLEDGVPTVTEKRLDRSDTFVVVRHAVLLQLTPIAEPSRAKLFSYNAERFSVALARPELAQDLLAVYNGALSMVLNQKQMLQSYDLNKFLMRPEGCRQDGAGQQVASTDAEGVNTFETDLFQDSGSPLAGLVDIVPQLSFNGTAKNEIVVNFPKEAGVNFAPTETFKITLVYLAEGFRLAGVNVNI